MIARDQDKPRGSAEEEVKCVAESFAVHLVSIEDVTLQGVALVEGFGHVEGKPPRQEGQHGPSPVKLLVAMIQADRGACS
jgi:hypothetical protein